MMDSRKNPRRPVRQGAWIFPGAGAPSIPCLIVDLSVSGARLRLDPSTQLPPQFILVMSRDGRLNRRCRTVWREDDMLGVQFLSRKSLGPQQAEAARRPAAASADEPADKHVEISDEELAAAIDSSNEAAQT